MLDCRKHIDYMYRKEKIILNTFEKEKSVATDFETVKLTFLPKCIEKEMIIEAISVPLICPDLRNYRTIEIARMFPR